MYGLPQDIWILVLKKLAFRDAYHLTCAGQELTKLRQTELVWSNVQYVASSQQQLGFILRLAPLFEHLELTVEQHIIHEEACPAKKSRLCLLRLAGISPASRVPLLGQLVPSPCQNLVTEFSALIGLVSLQRLAVGSVLASHALQKGFEENTESLEAAFAPLHRLHGLRLLQLGLVELAVLPTTLPGSCELTMDIKFELLEKLHPYTNLTELCAVTAKSRVSQLHTDNLPCLCGLRSLMLKAEHLKVWWLGTTTLPHLQSLKCVGILFLHVHLGSNLHQQFTGRLSLATTGLFRVSHTSGFNGGWFGINGLSPGLLNSLASFCVLGTNLDLVNLSLSHFATAEKSEGGRAWAPRKHRIDNYHVEDKLGELDIIATDSEGLEWAAMQFRAMCHLRGYSQRALPDLMLLWSG